MSKPEIYVSIDIETDGPAPGLNSMLALGAVAFHSTGRQLATWYATLHPLKDAFQDTGTMDWWGTQPEAWAEVNKDPRAPELAVPEFAGWVESLAGKPVAVAWPAAFDFAFVNYYCHRFASRNPLGFSCLDIRSYANGLAGRSSYGGLSEERLRAMAGKVETEGLRDHVALDDAIGQGRLFMALRTFADPLHQ
jgi:DNA polymerase III alpha subunit (gram-positive type)